MSGNSDQLAVLGQQVLDTLIATYNPGNDPALALALHPGQALADDIVQNGVTNPLRLSEWLEDQYDYPLLLKRSDATSVSASSVGSLTAKAAYLAMIPWALPGIPADAPAFARIAAMIADARRDLGDNPDALPFGCEPTDFAEADSTVWHVFDQKISSSTTSTTTGPVKANPQLWKMRALTEEAVSSLPSVSEVAERRRAFAAEVAAEPRSEAVTRLRLRQRPSDYSSQPVEFMTRPETSAPPPARFQAARQPDFSIAGALRAMDVTSLRTATTRQATRRLIFNRRRRIDPEEPPYVVAEHVGETTPNRNLDRRMLDRLATIQFHDLVERPAVTEVTTSGSELHVHFEYCLLTVTRRIAGRRWWHPNLIASDDWYVPGMRRGDMIKSSLDDGYAHCLPQGLIVVRNVEFSGSWTAEAMTTMQNTVSFLGPFLMRAPTSSATTASATEQISVLGAGVQVIGELCSPLPALPPMDDPAGPPVV